MVSIRIVSADYYMSYPNCDLDVVYSEFRGTEVRQVPVIQIFGSTQEGKKTCLNIHGVFPYLYIPYDGTENAGVLSYKIASELDKTINISLGQGSSNTCHVHNIILASGLPIYGYHEKQHQFFKIYFYNPAIIKKACSLLENGAILGKCYQPHESHISYILQFMVDYNLHGMSFVNVSQVKYRPNPKYPDQLNTFPKDKLLPSSLRRRSVCELEMDCFATDITNIEDILSGRLGSNPGITALWNDEKQRRRDKQQDSQISFCLSQERDVVSVPTETHEFFAVRLSDKLSSHVSSDVTSSSELDNSVYPAETPDDLDYTITPANLTTAEANVSMFEDTLHQQDNIPQELSQTDRNLLEILKELKENVHIDDDSTLSQSQHQQNALPGVPGEVEHSSGAEDEEEEEEVMLSHPLEPLETETNVVEVPDDIWNDSFWDENCILPQLDGTQSVNGLNKLMDDLLESGTSETEFTSGSSSSATMSQELRYANEVFIVHKSSKISAYQQLNPGINTLLTTEPKSNVSEKSRVKILSDLLVKPDHNVKLSWHVLTKQLQLHLNVETNDSEFVDPLPFADTSFENDLGEFDINEIVLNDVNMGNLSPSPMDTTLIQLSPKTPHAHANQCSCRQSPCTSGGNRLFADDCMNLFNDRLYENNLPSSGDKENVVTNTQRSQRKTLNAVKRNLKLVISNKTKTGKYNLRSLENTQKDKKKCCRFCSVDNKNCSDHGDGNGGEADDDKHNVVLLDDCTKKTKVKVKRPQLKLKQLLNKLETNRDKHVTADNDKRERILVQIPLAKIFKKRGRPKKIPKHEVHEVISISSSEEDATEPNKIKEKNNNKIVTTENKLINIPVKKRESISSTTESEELSSLSGTEITTNVIKKLMKINWNLDGQNDTPSSDSEHSQRNGIPEANSIPKPSIIKNKKSRVSGLTKKPLTNLDRTKRNSTQQIKKEPEEIKKEPEEIEKEPEEIKKEPEEIKKEPEEIKKEPEEIKKEPEEIKVTENGNFTSPRLLRNRKSNGNVKAGASNNFIRKRKSEIDFKQNSIDLTDEFKENKTEVNIVEIKQEKKTKFIEEETANSRPMLRNKSRYSESERNLKRQKRLSLSLKHLREQKDINESKNEIKNNLKELRVSLTQIPLDKLTKPTINPMKDLKIILEPLSPKILEKYSNKSNPQHKIEQTLVISIPKCDGENENQRKIRNSIKGASPPPLLYYEPELLRRETRSSIKIERITRQSSITNSNSDSCEEIDENAILKRLNTTPTKKPKTSSPSPAKKYSPLNVIKSPRSKVASPAAPIIANENEKEVEPLKRRLRNFYSSLRCSEQESQEQPSTLMKKVKTSAIDKDNDIGDSSRGIGELPDYPIIQEQGKINEGETKISETLEPLILSSPQNNSLNKNCDNSISIVKTNNNNNNNNSLIKTPDSIKTNLFNTSSTVAKNSIFNINNSYNNNNKSNEYKTYWKEREENFLNEIESICKNNNQYFDKNQKISEFKTPPKKKASPENSPNITPEKIFLQQQQQNNEQTPPKKPSIITNADYLDYSPFSSPEKGGTVNLPFLFNSRETLSQQFEKEMEDDFLENYTKTKNLTIAEKYDLARNYAPQPGTSKELISVEDDIIPNTPVSGDTSLHFEFSPVLAEASNILMPKYYPPSATDIRNSLKEYNIPEHRYETPFYGNPADVTRKTDVGNNVLKIPSKTIAELEEFHSCLGFGGIEKWRREKFKQVYSNVDLPKTKLYTGLMTSTSKSIIQPKLQPPSRQDVIDWLKTKTEEGQIKKPEKRRIVIPSSPGNPEDSDVSFTLSPDVITPTPPKPKPPKDTVDSPVSSQEQEQSPSLRNRRSSRRGNLQRKALFTSINKSSQDNFKNLNLSDTKQMNNSCQITGVTLNNTHDFKMSYENLQNAKAVNENQHLTILVIELHVRTRGCLNPDPQHDAIRAIFYSIWNDVPASASQPKQETGVIAVNTLPKSPTKKVPPPILNGLGLNCKITYVDSELDLIQALIELIQKWDPDIFSGFEIELQSWGYLIERSYTMGINLPIQISRTNPELWQKKQENFEPNNQDLKLPGRIILDAWRLFRHEIALTSYTFENLMYHILHQRVPHHTYKNLSFWWDHHTNHYRKIPVEYYITRTEGILKLMDQLDLIGRTSELARLFGIQFYEVLSRGSQFRVESMMLRLAKPLNYISVSPSVQQRAKMRAPEWIPLIFEPESRFYVDPIIVLDFQSLYPSIIIAYNYCYSTCVGRVDKLGTNQPFEFGATQLKVTRRTLQRLMDQLTFSPCGVGFVKGNVRKGILPRMLQEILETRLMVKASMKQNKEDKLLQRVLHSRQLGLKLIANVTYGYTAANFSGRMPCSEVGDSVVSKGRETLERAVKLIEHSDKWRARVVYGDTDSLFVQVVGRSRDEAFKIGEEIAEAVTRDNPAPVKLKLEKIYQPCILQTKKRYVGYMYESADQTQPEYNAKGIETVRRDGCPAVAKMLEKSLRILFETCNVSLVKRYVCHQFEKLLSGRASVQDLIFAREYRGAGGYRPGACVPALELTRRWTAVDKRKEPRRGERVPYIVVHGPPGVPLIRLVRCPKDLLDLDQTPQQIAYRPNAVYYITKVIIPPLNRCFTLIGADVNNWYNEMPRKQLQILPTDIHLEKSKKSTISEYFATMNCAVCNNQTREGLCDECLNKPQHTIVALQEKIHKWERSCHEINQICESCCGRNNQTECTSLDCPILYRLNQSKRDLKQVPFLRNLLCKF